MFKMLTDFRCLYKYLEERWASQMLEKGSIRVGTLHGFRTMEDDQLRRDPGEGTMTMTSNSLPTLGPRGANTLIIEERAPDAFVYCVSASFDPIRMRRFGGACVRIFDVAGFFGELDAALRLQCGTAISEGVLDKCAYMDRIQSWEHPLPRASWVKSKQFCCEEEVRAAWIPNSAQSLTAMVLGWPKLMPFIERFS